MAGCSTLPVAQVSAHTSLQKREKSVSEVVGIDVDPDAVQYARGTYYHPISAFTEGDVTDPGLPDKLGQFDSVVSFETMEHVEAEEQFLANVYTLLKPGGTLVLSTPFGKGRGKPCGSPFHVHQLTVDEFTQLFPDYTSVGFYFQKGALIKPADDHHGGHYPLGIAVCEK